MFSHVKSLALMKTKSSLPYANLLLGLFTIIRSLYLDCIYEIKVVVGLSGGRLHVGLNLDSAG